MLVTQEYGAISIDGAAGLSLVGDRSPSPHCPSLGNIAWALGSMLHVEGSPLPESWTAVAELVPDHMAQPPDDISEYFHQVLDDALVSFDGRATGRLSQEARQPPFEYTLEAKAVQWGPSEQRRTGFCVRVNSNDYGPLAYDCA